ncbi:lantibiotic dehydratase C-terminal domain-containing protein [Herpetosiphon llansteffanensis]
MPNPSQWHYRQVFLQPPNTPTPTKPDLRQVCDQMLIDWERTFGEQGSLRPHIDRWFFIRYGEGGYHVRLRYQSPPENRAATIDPLLDAELLRFFQDHAATVGLQHTPQAIDELYAAGYLRDLTYEPEYAKYAGKLGMALAEQHFAYSSTICLRVLQSSAGSSVARSFWVLELVHDLLEQFSPDPSVQALIVRSYLDYWIAQVVGDRAAFMRGLEQHFERQAPAIRQRLGSLRHNNQYSLFADWRAHLHNHFADLQAAEANQHLQSSVIEHFGRYQAQLPTIVAQYPLTGLLFVPNYLHLVQNRLGLSIMQELQLLYMLYRVLLAELPAEPISVPLILEPR